MNAPAALLALLLSQSSAPPSDSTADPARSGPAPERAPDGQSEPAAPPRPERPEPEPPETRALEPAAEPAPVAAPGGAAAPVRVEPRPPAAAPPPVRVRAPTPAAPPAAAAPLPAPEPLRPGAGPAPSVGAAQVPGQEPPAPAVSPARPGPEREQAARTALAFLDALVAGDASALTAQCAQRFSFDGDVRAGADAVLGGWREALAARRADGADRLLDLEVLPAAEAVVRLGPPPARVAPLAARGWVGIANVSGRPVVLFLAREGARMVVVGMHD
jgi:hypothetical protein